jgi:anti-sigma28 factor (negative regulator of flagellin synthesis)
MRIDNGALNLTRAVQSALTHGTSTPHHGHHAHAGDRVELSDLASQLAPDPSRLSQIEAAVDAGAYKVSPDQIANSLISDATSRG